MQNYIKINCEDFIFTDILIKLNIIGLIIDKNVLKLMNLKFATDFLFLMHV